MYTLFEEGVPMRASDRAYAALLEEIQGGVLAPGTVIGEVEQSSRLGVSRTPMREAIGRLVADGLVRQQSPRVLVVSGFDADDIRRLFEARRSFEETAARIAAVRGDRMHFAALATAFDAAHPENDALAADDHVVADGAPCLVLGSDYHGVSFGLARSHSARTRARRASMSVMRRSRSRGRLPTVAWR